MDVVDYVSQLVWAPDPVHVWVVAKHISSDESYHTCIKLSDKAEMKVSVKGHPKLLPVVSSTIKNIVSNLIWLEDLNDGAILHQIRRRFEMDKIYTSVGR